ncbi:efflux RND transporter periplasmic adaptor subunit [Ferrimonas pelagia]|uniref:HlyD family efflux transporter periplasmic adaptor subunit n=1 Tax=Ferrimonas pelagia TaxID=1177826 RepID=A0ABP9ESY5_9GAMM
MIQDTSGQDVQVNRSRRPRWLLPLLAVGGLIAGGGYLSADWLKAWGQGQQSIRESRLKFATVERGDMVREIAARGRIIAANAPVLYSRAAGRIELKVQAGHKVESGQIVAQIISPELQSELSLQQAQVESLQLALERTKLEARRTELELQRKLDQAQVSLTAAEREQLRADRAAESDLISDIDHQQVLDEFASAKISHAHAQREIALTRDTLKFEQRSAEVQLARQQLQLREIERQIQALQIRSPLDGMVGNTLVEDRDRIGANQPLLSVVSLTEYQAELEVPESYADELGLAMPVALEVAGQSFQGEIAGISPEIVANQVAVRVRFDPQSFKLRQNQRVAAQIRMETLADVLMLRRGPFIQSGQSRFGYRRAGELARKVPITLGASSLTHIEVLAGAAAGDQFIISDLSALLQSDEILIK